MSEDMIQVRTIRAQDGSIWAVPVDVIARDRAKHYANDYDGDVERSLAEDTLPFFAEDPFEIHDWAANNMNWSDVKDHAWRIGFPPPTENDMQEAWVNGVHGIETVRREDAVNRAGMRCIENMRIENKPHVIAAAEASGQAVEWRDEPDERTPAPLRDQYGSIWSNEADLSEFWRCFRGAQHQNG